MAQNGYSRLRLAGTPEGRTRRRDGSTMIKPIFFCLLVAGSAFAQMPKAASYTGETSNLIALERMWNQAQVSRDATAIAA